MLAQEFQSHVDTQLNICKAVLLDKAQEYATEDRLHNFRVAAQLQRETPVEALAGMMAKHTVSIYDMCDDATSYPLGVWEEKITDHINYLLLLKALISERPNLPKMAASITIDKEDIVVNKPSLYDAMTHYIETHPHPASKD